MVRSPEHATGKPVGFEHHRGPNGDAKGGKNGGQEGPHATGGGPAHAAATGSARRAAAPPAADSGPDAILAKFPGDAPLCDVCGHITIRNVTCYRCLNCGNSMGCS